MRLNQFLVLVSSFSSFLRPSLCDAQSTCTSCTDHEGSADSSSLLTHFSRGRTERSKIEGLAKHSRSTDDLLPLAIPRKLLFNYKINLFEAEAGTLDLHDAKLLQNMKRTVQWFQNITGEKADVEMWDDSQCLSGLQQLKAGKAEELGTPLAFDFAMEELGMIRSDLCRLVMLYNFGGYYFDTDMAPLDTLQKSLDLRATFVTVRASLRSGGGGGFFQSFLAATPQHPLMKRSLKKFKEWYDLYWTPGQDTEKLRQQTAKGNIGCALLEKSFQEWSASKSRAPLLVHQSGHVSQFFEEGQFDLGASPTPRQVAKYDYSASDSLCDWGVIDKMTNTVVIISRIYHRFAHHFCGQNVMFLGIPTP